MRFWCAPGVPVYGSPAMCGGCARGVRAAQDLKESDIVGISLRPEELEGLDDAALAAK